MAIDKRLQGLSKQDVCALRLRCIEPYISFASKNDVVKDVVFEKAEKSWEYMLKALGEKEVEDTPASVGSEAAK